MSRHIPLMLLLLAAAFPASAVDTLQVSSPDPVLERWRWTAFDQSHGLAGVVWDIYEDRDGNAWFATDHGAQRYDGIHWTTYKTGDGLADDRVRTIYQTRDGAMWFGTVSGDLSRFDGQAWTTYAFRLPNITGPNFVQTGDGILWVGFPAGGGVHRFDGLTWTEVPGPQDVPQPSVRDILEASDGTIWITTFRQGALRFDGQSWTRYTTREGLADDTADMILESRDGALWFPCSGAGISRFDGRQWNTYTDRDGLPAGVGILSLWQTEEGALWASGTDGTLCRFDGTRWHPYASGDLPGLRGELHGRPGRGGVVWFYSIWQDRVFRFDRTAAKWTVYEGVMPTGRVGAGRMGGEPDLIFAFENQVWFGGNSGVVCYDGTTWIKHTPADGLIDGPVQTVLQAHDGSIWVGGQHRGRSGVARYDGTAWQVFTEADGLRGANIYTGFVAANGDLWFGTKLYGSSRAGASSHGAIRFDGTSWTVYTVEDGLAHNMVYDIEQTPDGAMWFATRGGLSRFEGSDWTAYTPGENPGSPMVIGLLVDRSGSLWIASSFFSRGVVRFDGQTWERYTAEDGLGGDLVSRIYESRDGTLWFGVSGGLTRFDGVTWTTYPNESLPTHIGNSIDSICESADGALWLRGSRGHVIRFLPDANGPETFLESTVERVSSAGNLLLTWSGHDLWNNTPQETLRYQWRVDGGPWSPASRRTDCTLTALSAGSHLFEVRAVDRDMNMDATPSVHTFVVESPWWKNPWVVGLTAVLLGLVGVQTTRVVRRGQKLRATNRELAATTRRAEAANQAKSRFLASMSHELRTPLNGILGYAQILNRDQTLPPQHKGRVSIIQQSGEHLLGLINEVLDLARIEARRTELEERVIQLPAVLNDLAALTRVRAQQKGVSFVYDPHTPLPETVRSDPRRLRQVLLNLLGNAVKFTEKGTVSLQAEILGRSTGHVQVRFAIQDTGVGMTPEEAKAIFQPFEQVGDANWHAEGTGLGLSISRQLVRLMGGEIRVESTPGQGSRFWFDLDLPEVQTPTPDALQDERFPVGFQGGPKKVLVVDDKVENRSVLVDLLSPLGFQVVEAEDGQQGLDRAADFKPDLILTDLVMPVLDGYEVVRRLRQAPEPDDVTIFALSASVFDQDRQQSLDAGCDDFVPKPVQAEILLDKIRQHLNLEWVYEAGPESEEVPVVQDGPLLAPPHEELALLLELARRGRILEIRERIDRIEERDEAFGPFASTLRDLATGIRLKEICAFLEPHLEEPQ